MNIRLHANATTTPKIRRFIRESDRPIAQLAKELHVSEDTIRRWKRRDRVADGSHTPHRACRRPSPRPRNVVVVELRKTLLLPLDDLLVVTREYSSTPRPPAPLWTAVYAATGLPTSRPCCPRRKAPRRR